MLGTPAIPMFEQAQVYAMLTKLPEMRKAIRRIENQLAKATKTS
jgi:hypothetical protein